MIQLQPTIPVWIPHRQQPGIAIGWIDYSSEHDCLWKVILRDGTIWDFPQSQVRGQENASMGRNAT